MIIHAVMIITGTRGMGKVKRTILGSVSDYLVNHAICPVKVCRDPAVFEHEFVERQVIVIAYLFHFVIPSCIICMLFSNCRHLDCE